MWSPHLISFSLCFFYFSKVLPFSSPLLRSPHPYTVIIIYTLALLLLQSSTLHYSHIHLPLSPMWALCWAPNSVCFSLHSIWCCTLQLESNDYISLCVCLSTRYISVRVFINPHSFFLSSKVVSMTILSWELHNFLFF